MNPFRKGSVGLALGLALMASTTVRAADADPCLESMDLDSGNLTSFLSSSLQTRIMTMCELRDAVEEQYSMFDLKKERITNADGTPFDSLAHLNQCVLTEKSITNDDSDLHFLDRVSQCIAGFHDTHFWTAAPVPLPPVFTGISVRQIGGKYYIQTIMPDVLAYDFVGAGGQALGTNAQANLQFGMVPGNQVVSIDGQDPAVLSAHYASYISGSSPDFIREQADQAIFFRAFDYPTKNAVAVKIQDPTGKVYNFQLPWWGGIGAHNRADAMAYFQKLNIPISDRVKIALNVQLNKPDWRTINITQAGYDDTKPLFGTDGFNNLVEYDSDDGSPGMRTGEVVAPGGKAFCYMELLTFETANFKDAASGNSASFGDTIRNFVISCGAKNLDLVLDLRNNPGGNGDFPDLLLSLLTPQNTTLPAPVLAMRVTADMGKLLSSDYFQPEVAYKDLGDLSTSLVDVFNQAVAAGQTETAIIPNTPLPADGKVNGYSGRILVLVSPSCVSACDMTASLLKKSGRAVLLGTHSNGTGAGFYSSAMLDSTFKDSNDELAIKIPNFMFGVPDKVLDPTATVPYAQNEANYLLENKPTIADIQYNTTLDDLNPLNPGAGWQAAVAQAFNAMPPAPAPTPSATPSAASANQ